MTLRFPRAEPRQWPSTGSQSAMTPSSPARELRPSDAAAAATPGGAHPSTSRHPHPHHPPAEGFIPYGNAVATWDLKADLPSTLALKELVDSALMVSRAVRWMGGGGGGRGGCGMCT